jgi:hypothetical protein
MRQTYPLTVPSVRRFLQNFISHLMPAWKTIDAIVPFEKFLVSDFDILANIGSSLLLRRTSAALSGIIPLEFLSALPTSPLRMQDFGSVDSQRPDKGQ